MRKILEENAKIFNKANELRGSTEKANPYIYKEWKIFKEKLDERDKQILALESQHKSTINKLSSDDKIAKAILPFISNKEKDIQREAMFVVVESKNKEYIQRMVELTLPFSLRDSEILYEKLGFISIDAFGVLFEVVEKVGFTNSRNNHNLIRNMLSYIAIFQLSDLAKKFTKLDDFPMSLQGSILSTLSFFEEFKDVVIEAYINGHPEYTKDPTENVLNIALPLLLYKEEKTALKLMRDKQVIIQEYGGTSYLSLLGDKKDGLIMAEALKEGYLSDDWKKHGFSYRSQWLYQKLKDAYDVSNPLLIEGMIDIFPEIVKDMNSNDEDEVMYAEELYDILSTMLGHQFGFPDQKHCEVLAKKLSDEQLPVHCWKEHPKKDMRKKFLAAENDPYSIYRSLLFELTNKFKPPYIALYDNLEFIVMTGEKYIFNSAGYYSNLKPQIEKWLAYVEAHKEQYEDGRWFRYGRYVDVPYTPMGMDDIKMNKIPKDFLKK